MKAPDSLRIAMIGTRGLGVEAGGVERAVAALSRGLVRSGQDVTVYGRSAYCDPGISVHDGVRQISLPHLRGKRFEAASHSLLAALHAVTRGNFDVIHFHAVGPTAFSLIPRVAGKPTVATVHALDWEREKWGPVARQMLRAAGYVATVAPHSTTVVSRGLQSYFSTQHNAACRYIPNGVEFDSVETQQVDGLRTGRFVLFLGRLVPEKGVHTLVKAFRSIDTDVTLAIAGAGTHSDEYVRGLHDDAAADPRIRFLGPRYGPEKNWLLHNNIGFVQPSTLEGLPIALLEALTANSRVIVSDIEPHVEILNEIQGKQSETDGVFTFAAGSETALVQALVQLLTDAPERRPNLVNSLEEHYSWERVIEATLCVYRATYEEHSHAKGQPA